MKKGASFFLSIFVSMALVTTSVAPVFAQLSPVVVPPTPTPPPVVPPPEPVAAPTPPVQAPSTSSVQVTPQAVTPTVAPIIAPADTTAPAISGVANLSLGLGEATIVWTTDELAISTLEYGTTQGYGTQASIGASALLAHTAILTGLSANTVYYYCIHATDLAGNTANSCGHSFTTAAHAVIADTTPPDVTLITETTITTTSATIGFTTSEVGNARIEYGTTAGYGETTPLDTNLALTHSVTLSNLTPNTLYHYRIITSDEVGNETITSDETFMTEAMPVSSPTSPSQGGSQGGAQVQVQSQASTVVISGIETASISTSAVTIVWETNLPSDSQVEYGDSDNLGSLTTLDTTLTSTHSVTINNLAANTNYIFRVKSKPLGATVATVSNTDEFDTLNHSIPVVAGPNVSSVAVSSVTDSYARISWDTDKSATSQVEYGITTGYGALSVYYQELTNFHSVLLTNLDAGITYHFRVKSTDEVSNITYSEDYTFTTSGVSISSNTSSSSSTSPTLPVSAGTDTPHELTTLAILGYDAHSTLLGWHIPTDTSDATQLYDIRYSTSPITESNFAQATEAQITPIYHSDLSPNGVERSYIVAGLDAHTTYYVALKSKHEHSSYSTLSNVVMVTTTSGASVENGGSSANYGGGANGGGSAHSTGSGQGGNATYSYVPTAIKVEPADNQIIFEWNNPGEENFVRTVVVKKSGSYPVSPADGETIYEGRGVTFTDTNVHNGTTYYYALYSYNHNKIYSKAIHVSLAPSGGNKEIKFNESGSLASSTPVFHFVRNFKKGDKDIEIEHLQEILLVDQDNYPEKYVTGYFGSLTEAALKRFQKKHGLSQTGMVDTATQSKLNTVSHSETKLNIPTDYVVFGTDLKYGDEGEAVKDLQQFLIYEGSYAEALVSGRFGNYTKNAVKIFQKKYAVSPVSGYVGVKTRHRMQQLTGL